jgi:soluble lytic murein transglycosylase
MTLTASCLLVGSSVGQQENAPGQPAAEAAASTPSSRVSEAERMRLRDGLAAAESGDWTGLMTLRDGATDPLVRRMLQWRLATAAEAPVYFSDLRNALNDLQGWPGRTNMRARAEQAILDTRLSADERIGFLRQEGGPVSGDGRIALAIALKDSGQRSEAIEMARAAWREDTLTSNAEARALDEFGSNFTARDYADRVDILLWRGQRSDARRFLSHVSAADRAVANARIAMQSRQRRGLQAAVEAVPGSREDDPGFQYDRVQYRRRTDQPVEAMQLAARRHLRRAAALRAARAARGQSPARV